MANDHVITWSKIREQFRDTRRALICCHAQVDGDAYNAVVSMSMLLESLGIHVEIGCQDRLATTVRLVDHAYSFVQVQPTLASVAGFDVMVILDTAVVSQLGSMQRLYSSSRALGIPVINIDHHEVNPRFGDLNIVDPQAAATCEVLYTLFAASDMGISADMAHALLKGIFEDTDVLRTYNVTARTLRTAASLVDLGADRMRLVERAMSIDVSQARAWGKVLAGLRVTGQNQNIAYSTADESVVGPNAKYEKNVEGVTNFIRDTLRGVDIAVLFVQREKEVKLSLRSRSNIDAGAIAKTWGGGGHYAAAGCEFPGKTIAEVQHEVLRVVERAVEAQMSSSRVTPS